MGGKVSCHESLGTVGVEGREEAAEGAREEVVERVLKVVASSHAWRHLEVRRNLLSLRQRKTVEKDAKLSKIDGNSAESADGKVLQLRRVRLRVNAVLAQKFCKRGRLSVRGRCVCRCVGVHDMTWRQKECESQKQKSGTYMAYARDEGRPFRSSRKAEPKLTHAPT